MRVVLLPFNVLVSPTAGGDGAAGQQKKGIDVMQRWAARMEGNYAVCVKKRRCYAVEPDGTI